MKRFITEYANYKIRFLKQLEKEYPHQTEEYEKKIYNVNKIVWMYKRGYIIIDECMRLISNA